MGTRLFVGNLSYNVNEQELKEVFQSENIVVRSVRVAFDRDTQRPRGFAFVETETDEGAKQSIEKLGGRLVQGRPLDHRGSPSQARAWRAKAGWCTRWTAPFRRAASWWSRSFWTTSRWSTVDGTGRTAAQLWSTEARNGRFRQPSRGQSSAEDGDSTRTPREEEINPAEARRAGAGQLALERNSRRRLD